MASVITSQPRAQETPEDPNQVIIPLTEQEQEEEARKRENRNIDEEVYCCVLDAAEDTWCLFQCIAMCFRAMGECLDGCCESCAECVANCCETSNDTSSQAEEDCFWFDWDCTD